MNITMQNPIFLFCWIYIYIMYFCTYFCPCIFYASCMFVYQDGICLSRWFMFIKMVYISTSLYIYIYKYVLCINISIFAFLYSISIFYFLYILFLYSHSMFKCFIICYILNTTLKVLFHDFLVKFLP